MDPLSSWVDADDVRRLAARLIEPARDPSAPVPAGEPGFDAGFIGFIAERPAPAEATAAMPAAPAPAAGPGPAVSRFLRQAPEAPMAASQSERGPFLEKIRSFREWMCREFAAAGVFILDREGAVIFDDGPHERFHFLARSLALALQLPGASTGNVRVKIGTRVILEVIPVETASGCHVLGAVVPAALPPESVRAVTEALAAITAPAAGR